MVLSLKKKKRWIITKFTHNILLPCSAIKWVECDLNETQNTSLCLSVTLFSSILWTLDGENIAATPGYLNVLLYWIGVGGQSRRGVGWGWVGGCIKGPVLQLGHHSLRRGEPHIKINQTKQELHTCARHGGHKAVASAAPKCAGVSR